MTSIPPAPDSLHFRRFEGLNRPLAGTSPPTPCLFARTAQEAVLRPRGHPGGVSPTERALYNYVVRESATSAGFRGIQCRERKLVHYWNRDILLQVSGHLSIDPFRDGFAVAHCAGLPSFQTVCLFVSILWGIHWPAMTALQSPAGIRSAWTRLRVICNVRGSFQTRNCSGMYLHWVGFTSP